MVFLDGSEKYLPWKPNAIKLLIISKMCITYKKPLLTCNVGMQILIFFIATNYYTMFNVVNSDGKLDTIENINEIPKNFLQKLRKNDYFLDFVTGDLLLYVQVSIVLKSERKMVNGDQR